ncbi:C-Jun-amino-terminal kinase-interacting 4-like [Schistosoma japonicum]|nr:C-Jun-amino-terminal kinase-interacting 4-like [Schistosoma japonicum]KAH8857022.1 C-Jun-amino-terminal kinase-interacting 4-like [Schistosoma japonicum]
MNGGNFVHNLLTQNIDDGMNLWVCNVIDGNEMWINPDIKMNVMNNILTHIKMMARCCGCKLIGGDELRINPQIGRNTLNKKYSHLKKMAKYCEWVRFVHNLLPHIKMMARCCGCKLIGGD